MTAVGASAPRWAAALLAVAVPSLLAFNLPPSATFLNQAASLIGWSLWLALLAAALPRPGRLPSGLAAVLAALALLAVATVGSMVWAGLPGTLGLSSLGMLAAAALTAWVAAELRAAGHAEAAFDAFCIALLVAGALSAIIGVVQVFDPDATGGPWIAATGVGDRAVGNLRQPNHLSSLLLWAMTATVFLLRTRRLPAPIAWPLYGLMLFAVVLTGSRTGLLGTLLLAVWGALDRTLDRRQRLWLLATPVVYAALWLLMAEWARLHAQVFAGEIQLSQSNLHSSRVGIWKNTLVLIAQHPWLGVGFGEFNFAWSLTPFPDRPVAFFDHTHNLLLQFAVELGLPLATLVVALLVWALVEAWLRPLSAAPESRPMLRAALVVVLMAALHSQVEYPLWYAYFLLPAAFAFGLCLGRPPDAGVGGETPVPGRRVRAPAALAAALLLLAGSVAALLDYQRVVVIFSPPAGAPPLAQRIQDGQRSWFFGHHADYAAVTTAARPSDVLPAFRRATHYLLDTRLMMAWAVALHEAGHEQHARHLAQRLREFRNEQSAEFFAPCDDPSSTGERPFQCLAPTVPLDYRSFR
ncbi:MAG: O-antigen ligase C-terminal domain-containing protein [Piscinibacter sp.]|nr:O-antigen ligase C-terminal domain-containing protein [Piscinibacter sp.]